MVSVRMVRELQTVDGHGRVAQVPMPAIGLDFPLGKGRDGAQQQTLRGRMVQRRHGDPRRGDGAGEEQPDHEASS